LILNDPQQQMAFRSATWAEYGDELVPIDRHVGGRQSLCVHRQHRNALTRCDSTAMGSLVGFHDLDPVTAIAFGPVQRAIGALDPVLSRLIDTLRGNAHAHRYLLVLQQGGLLDT
jgi:hypothetical protein